MSKQRFDYLGAGMFVALVIGVATARAASPAAATLPPGQDATVVRAVDGDTIEVKIAGRSHTVRYIGVDTPETVKPATPVQCYGKEASAYNKTLVAGKAVRLVKDVSESDRYGRLLRYVYLADGRMVNELLLQGGYAQVSTYPPDVRHVDGFLELQRAARDAGAGLWGKCSAPAATAAATATPKPAAQAPAGDTPCHCGPPDLDCGDFDTEAEAQACWDFCGGQIDGPNPHKLDGKDNDGDVCESLP
jgi:micrococcal nuclease